MTANLFLWVIYGRCRCHRHCCLFFVLYTLTSITFRKNFNATSVYVFFFFLSDILLRLSTHSKIFFLFRKLKNAIALFYESIENFCVQALIQYLLTNCIQFDDSWAFSTMIMFASLTPHATIISTIIPAHKIYVKITIDLGFSFWLIRH